MFGSRRRGEKDDSAPPLGSLTDPDGRELRLPDVDFLIVGAMKCGTTSLRRALSAHATIHMPERELHFFGHHERYLSVWDGGQLDATRLEELYAAHLRPPGTETVVGTKTPNYMISSLTLERIQRFHPAARIVVMVREPVSRAESHWNHLLRQAESGRLPARRLAATCAEHLAENRAEIEGAFRPDVEVRGTNVLWRGLYAPQIRRIHRLFPRERVFVGVLDDLRDDARAFYERLLGFLGVAFDDAVIDVPRDAGRPQKRYELSAAERADLAAFYEESVRDLETLLGRNLPGWPAA